MPTREEVKQLFGRGSIPRRGSAPPPAAAAAPRQQLKPPPEGYAYRQDPVHGYVLVQIAMPAIPGGGVQPSRLVGPNGQPVGARGPALQRSAQLLRPGIDPATQAPVDKYSEWLGQLRDLTEVPAIMEQYGELVPDLSIMDQYVAPPPISSELGRSGSDDPSADAWGVRGRRLQVGDLG